MDLEDAVEAVSSSGQPPERQREGLETVRKLLGNIMRAPLEAKFREVRKSNPALQRRLFPECFDLLLAAGFQADGDVLLFRGDPDATFEQVALLLDSLIVSLGDGAPLASSSSREPAARPQPSSASIRPQPSSASRAPVEAKRTTQQLKQDRQREESRKTQASAQQELAALRQQRAGQYQEQQDAALAQHLSRADIDSFDPISALNHSRGATHSFVSCPRCGVSLRYNSNTRAQAVLCPCGNLLQPVHMRGQAWAPRAPADLPVEPGEPVDSENRPRTTRGPFISVRGPDGQTSRLPLHSVLQMVRQHEEQQAVGASEANIEALPTREFHAAQKQEGGGEEMNRCQICLEDFGEGDTLRTLPCFHLFHAACVDQWLKGNGVCPTCRHKVA